MWFAARELHSPICVNAQPQESLPTPPSRHVLLPAMVLFSVYSIQYVLLATLESPGFGTPGCEPG